jgi:hypothetical protein
MLKGNAEMTIRILITILFLSALAIGQDQKTTAPQKTEWIEIASYAKSIEQFTRHNPRQRRLFAKAPEKGDHQDNWRAFKTARQMEQAGLDESAYVWLKDGKVVAAKFSFTSQSGDWYHFVNYYFRDDGTLAKIHAQLNTFVSPDGGLSVVRERFYGSNGGLLHTSTTYLDLHSQRPRKRGDFMDEPIPVYLRVRDLPFSKLL